MSAAHVLADLARIAEPPAIVICARAHQPARLDFDLTQDLHEVAAVEMAEVLERAAQRGDARRFTGAPLTGFGGLTA